MEIFFIENENGIRLSCFILVLLLMWGLEYYFARRKMMDWSRWAANVSILAIAVIILRMLPLSLVGLALLIQQTNFGVLNYLELEGVLNVLISLLLFDLTIYLQHVGFHKLPFMWRIHRVHHTDMKVDVSTGLRFHPAEILLSWLLKAFVVCLLGASAIAALIYEIALSAMSIFTHANLSFSKAWDKRLRTIIVTPNMHRIHHSTLLLETDSNYGNLFSFWDRLFGTYVSTPQNGYDNIQVGLDEFPQSQPLWRLLVLPLKR